jgi:thymidylate synthase ThyX
VILDEGAYLELKRHRMMTQTPAPFTPCFGYAVPRQIEKAGLLNEYDRVMKKAAEAYGTLAVISQPAASYVLPNAYNRQVLLQSNMRSLYHFLALRSAPQRAFFHSSHSSSNGRSIAGCNSGSGRYSQS